MVILNIVSFIIIIFFFFLQIKIKILYIDLLEKSRVVRQAAGERSYHIFYQIMSGYNPNLREQLKLTNDITYYHFPSQAELTIEGK